MSLSLSLVLWGVKGLSGELQKQPLKFRAPIMNKNLETSRITHPRNGLSSLCSFALLLAGLGITASSVGCGVIEEEMAQAAAVEVAHDLLGETVWTGTMNWRFAGPEEFEDVEIVSVSGNDDETRFIVDMDLVDMYSGERWAMRAGVEYDHWNNSDNWRLRSITCMHWEER